MLAFASMLVLPAKQGGIKVPKDPDNFDTNKYPHFTVYCNFQLGRPILTCTSHWDNAKVIATIPNNMIKAVTLETLINMGCS